ncbi:MAG TPA: hypothetical protein PKY77_12675 [Phycisphaerae bacterium]|nr:hypothetical protein [Phycisphaerae bacterium]HRY69183.1 hypothetical protein [Phycisphaerae bacterium]HSA26144.1 hypothetical protein [Phycisphaerae bacterium]
MPVSRDAFKLGLTMMIFLALLLAVLIFLAPRGAGDMVFKVRYPVSKLSTVLKPGGQVQCGGLKVGTITKVAIDEVADPQNGHKSLFTVITFKVQSSLGLRDDCRIVPVGLLLGEGGSLVIQDRGVGRELAAGSTVRGTPVADLSSLMQTLSGQLDPKDPTSLLAMAKSQLDASDAKSLLGKIHKSLDDINAVTRNISNDFDPQQKSALLAKLHVVMDNFNQTTGSLREQMDRSANLSMLNKLHNTLDKLQEGIQTVADMLRDNREPITQTVANVRETSEIVDKQIAARIAEQLDPATATSLMARVHTVVERLEMSLKDINSITGTTREIVVLNREQITAMIGNLKETSDHLNATAEEVRASPWRLFYRPTAQESAEAQTLDVARTFSRAATRLNDTAARLQALDGAVPAKDPRLAEIRYQLQEVFVDFQKAEQALWEKLKVK